MPPKPKPNTRAAAEAAGAASGLYAGGNVATPTNRLSAAQRGTNPRTPAELATAINGPPAAPVPVQTADQAAATQQAADDAAAQAQTQQVNQQSASSIIASTLSQVPALAQLDPSGILNQWIQGQITTYAGQNMSGSDIAATITATMNNPTNDPAAKAVFDAVFPGYNQKIQNGTSNGMAGYTGLAGYIAYASQLQSFAHTAGLTPGTITPQQVGNAWANDVSADEMSARITTGYTEALQAVNTVPGFAQFMNQNYGLSVGDLASHYLNPSISLQTLQNQYNASAVAGATGQVGMGQLDQAQAESVAHFLANSNTSGLGGNGAVNLGQVEAGLTSSLTGVGASAAQLNPYTAGTSRAGEQNLSENTLLGAALENNASDIQTVQTAVGSRTAGSRGGGGFSTNQNGAEGVGFASE